MWLLLNVAEFEVLLDITKCVCTPPNVATSGVHMDITKCGYFCTPPNVAPFGVLMDITKINVYSTKCGNVNVWKCFEQCVLI